MVALLLNHKDTKARRCTVDQREKPVLLCPFLSYILCAFVPSWFKIKPRRGGAFISTYRTCCKAAKYD
jgi:hypothetical protein